MKYYSNTEKHQKIQQEAEERFRNEYKDKPVIDKKSKKLAKQLVTDDSKPAHQRLYENTAYQRDKSTSSERSSTPDPEL